MAFQLSLNQRYPFLELDSNAIQRTFTKVSVLRLSLPSRLGWADLNE